MSKHTPGPWREISPGLALLEEVLPTLRFAANVMTAHGDIVGASEVESRIRRARDILAKEDGR